MFHATNTARSSRPDASPQSPNLATSSSPHPLDQLRGYEIDVAREVAIKARGQHFILFRAIFLQEPLKADLVPFLHAEHDGRVSSESPRPARLAKVQYDVIHDDKSHEYMESLIDVNQRKEVLHRLVDKKHQAALTMEELTALQEACMSSSLYREAISQFTLPEGFEVTIDPWPYGGPDPEESVPRYTQGLCFAKDMRNGSEDSNHYGYPLPIIPVMDTCKSEIIRIDKLATGGKEDGLAHGTTSKNVLDHCRSAEYIPELLEIDMRQDLKPLNVLQPEGPSFKVSNDSLVEWQKWRFRVGFNPREGATLHDIHYDGRSIMYRLSFSEMTVPYGDPRPPFHRKQAFDIGDGGAGRAANNLALGCDCLGLIRYFDAVFANSEGHPSVAKNVVCLHEQDGGIGWKHTNFRTGRAAVTRSRELVVQFVITLANYEYSFAYKFDQAGGISIEIRATGIVSVVNIDKGKTSPWGNVVSPGALAQHHQHIFAVRMDPAIDGHRNTIFREESLPLPMSPEVNPWGNGFQLVSHPISTSCWLDASPATNLTVKMSNTDIYNPISGKPVSYKFIPPPTQLLLADKNSIVAKRAAFAQHHVWLTSYRDGELWAAGEFTNQSQAEVNGVADAAARKDNIEAADVVVWAVFGMTHIPHVEDWPVMPMEKLELHLRPADFFTFNPALDVPGMKNTSSVEVGRGQVDGQTCCEEKEEEDRDVQEAPTSHGQGMGSVMPGGDSKL